MPATGIPMMLEYSLRFTMSQLNFCPNSQNEVVDLAKWRSSEMAETMTPAADKTAIIQNKPRLLLPLTGSASAGEVIDEFITGGCTRYVDSGPQAGARLRGSEHLRTASWESSWLQPPCILGPSRASP